MLLAVFMGDKTLFDGAVVVRADHKAVGNAHDLVPSQERDRHHLQRRHGGSATDADEDMAFALVEAGNQWAAGPTPPRPRR